MNASSTISNALLAVAREWQTEVPTFAEWVAGIPDPEMRNLAQHARLFVLAEKNPQAALAELYSANLERTESIDAASEILKQLTKTAPVAALELLKRVEDAFSKSEIDPFSDTSDLPPDASSPFRHLNPGRYGPPYEVENNGARRGILSTAASTFPADPSGFFDALHKVGSEMAGNDLWQREVEAELIRLKSASWSCNECLQVAHIRATETNGAADDVTFRELAKRAVQTHPELTLSAFDKLPESARASFAGELTKHFSDDTSDVSAAMMLQLTPSQWDADLGKSLGKNAEDYHR